MGRAASSSPRCPLVWSQLCRRRVQIVRRWLQATDADSTLAMGRGERQLGRQAQARAAPTTDKRGFFLFYCNAKKLVTRIAQLCGRPILQCAENLRQTSAASAHDTN